MKPYGVLLAFVCGVSAAADLTITGTNCSSWAFSGNTVACVTGTTPPDPPKPPIDPPIPPVTGDLSNCSNQGFGVIPYNGPVYVAFGTGVSAASGAFGNNTVWLFTMTVPAPAQQTSGIGRFDVVEYGSSPTIRQMSLSTVPCDFRPKDYSGANGPLSVSQGVSVGIQYNTVPPQIFGGIAGLTPGRTYYVSVRNYSTDLGSWSCPGSCDALMNHQPQGASAMSKKQAPAPKQKPKK